MIRYFMVGCSYHPGAPGRAVFRVGQAMSPYGRSRPPVLDIDLSPEPDMTAATRCSAWVRRSSEAKTRPCSRRHGIPSSLIALPQDRPGAAQWAVHRLL